MNLLFSGNFNARFIKFLDFFFDKGLTVEWINTLDKTINNWMNINNWSFDLFGHTHKIKPEFLSITRKNNEAYILKVADGDIYEEYTDFADGYSIQALVGEKNRGFAHVLAVNENVAKTPEGFLVPLNASIDGVLKGGLNAFLINRASDVVFKNNLNYTKFNPVPIVKHLGELDKKLLLKPSKKEVKRIIELSEKLRHLPHVESASINLSSGLLNNWFVNSEGTKIRTSKTQGYGSWNIMLKNKDSTIRNLIDSFIYTQNNNLNDLFKLENSLPNLSKRCENLYNAPKLKSGSYPVIFSGSAFAVLMHEAVVAHLLSGWYVADGVSNIFKDRVGDQIMSEFISIHTKPNLKDGYGSFEYDEEGVKSIDDVLVERGILKNYLHNRKSSSKLGMKNNGHMRSEWVGYYDSEGDFRPMIPEPRVSNTIIESHSKYSNKQLINIMIEDCVRNGKEFGLYVSDVPSGEVSIEDSAFTISPSEVWAIYPTGKKQLLSGISLIGDSHSLLKSIKACSNQYEIRYSRCGSNSGFVSTQDIAPNAYLPRISVRELSEKQLTDKIADF